MNDALHVVGLGNALVDALIQMDEEELLSRENFERGEMHLVDHDRWDAVYRMLPGDEIIIRPGGSAANAVVTFALMGGEASFCGQVGDDPLGSLYSERLEERLGRHHLHFQAEQPTGKCLSLVSRRDAERTMITDLGCASGLPVEAVFVDDVTRAQYLHLTGYSFTGGSIGDAALSALKAAKDAGVGISFDAADPFVVRAFQDKVRQIISDFADIVFLNEEEARELAGGSPSGVFSLFRPDQVAVVKLGSRGSLIQADGNLYPVEAVPVAAIDTTGAGDAYAGGFLYGAVQGMDWQRCGRLGSRIASCVVGQLGSVVEDQDLLRKAIKEIS